MANTSEMTRKQMGLINIQNKSYPIYEGLNVIGRDTKAAVLVKKETFSRQHAVISVVDENTHLVSDFGSSNGTRLRQKCLIPYKFYRINDKERITIGDTMCFYQKTTGSCKVIDTSITIDENASNTEPQFDGHDAPTQVIPENINVNSLKDTQDLPPTQVMFKQPQNPDKNVNESLLDNDDLIPSTQDFDKPTQKVVIVAEDTSHESNKQPKRNPLIFDTSTQDDCLTSTECNDEILANETLQLSLNDRGNIGMEVEETMLVIIESDNESVDMLNAEQVTQCIQGSSSEELIRKSAISNQKQIDSRENELESTVTDTGKCSEPACNNNDKGNDNFETSFKNDDKNEQVKIRTKEHGSEKSTRNIDKASVDLESAVETNERNNDDDDSETDMEVDNLNTRKDKVKNVSENVDDDDSETDMDDTTNKKKVTRRRRVRKQLEIGSKNIDDDSETDMEDFSTVKSKKPGTKMQVIQSNCDTDIENNKNLEKLKDNSRLSTNNNNELTKADNVIDISSGSETEIEDEDLITKIKNLEAISTSKSESTTEQIISEKKQNVVQYHFSSEDEIDLLAPTEKLADSFTGKNTQQIAEHIDDNESSCENVESVACTKRNNEETYSLAPTQLLEPLQTSLDTSPYEVSIHEAETQIVADVDKPDSTNEKPKSIKEGLQSSDLADRNECKKICEVSYSLAPAQLVKQTTPSCSSSPAPAQILQSPQKSPDNKSNETPVEEAGTQLVDPVEMPANNNQQEEQTAESDSLAPTQLLLPAQISSIMNQDETSIEKTETQPGMSSDGNQHEKQVEDLDFLAPTQLLEHSASNRNNDDDDTDYLAKTQLLPSEVRSTINKQREHLDDIDYLAPTQPLRLNSLKSTQNDDYLAPTQLLPLRKEDGNIEVDENANLSSDDEFSGVPQSTPIVKSISAKEIVRVDSDDEIFLAPTQKLPLKTSLCKKRNLPEDKFSAPTQNIPETDEDDHEEHSIFSAPTQKLATSSRISLGMKRTPEENEDAEDDDLLAPTQLLKVNTNVPKSPENYDFDFSYTDDPHYMNVDYGSDDTSMRLGISCNNENEDFIAPTQKLELSKNVPAGSANKKGKSGKLTEVLNVAAKLPEPESQLEVDFALSTQKLYLEKATCRPNNPLAHMFEEENTQLTETETVISIVSANKKTETDTSQTLSSDTEISDSSLIGQSKKRRFEDDLEKGNSKKTKKNVRQPKNKIDVIITDTPRRTSKRVETVNSKYSQANLNLKEVKHGETPSTPKIQKRKAEKKTQNVFEEAAKMKPSTSDMDLKRKVSDDKHREKDKGDKSHVTEIEKNLDTPRRMSTRAGRKTEERELETARKMAGKKTEERALETPRKMAGRKSEEQELETPRKMATRKGKKSNDTQLEPHLKDKQESENVKELLKNYEIFNAKVVVSKLDKDEESKKEEVYYKKPFDRQTVPKRETRGANRKADISSNTPEEIASMVNTRTTRSKSSSTEESIEFGSSKENISELVDTVSKTRKPRQNAKKTRTRQTKNKFVDNEDESIEIVDSDDSTNSNIERHIKKKVLKVDYTDESCSGSSVASTVVLNLRHNKRSLKIADYSSDEISNKNENTNSENTFSDTLNKKRRKYEPLNVTTNNISQTSSSENGSFKHNVVFTMLNKPELETAVKELGGNTIDSVHLCTVLVTNKISRSLKFLIAVSEGKPIVSIKWILESRKKKMFLDPWDYLLEDPDSENKYKFSLKESLLRARRKVLLIGYTILLVVNKNFEVLKEIIETCGGRCVTRAPAKSAGANVVVVAYEDEKSKYSRYLKQRTVVAAEAIFSGVLTQQLNFENHLLS